MLILRLLEIIRLAHLQCESFLFWSTDASVVCCLSRVRSQKLSEIGAKFHRVYRKLGLPSTNMILYRE